MVILNANVLILNSCSALVAEGRAGQPKMMTVGLHCRLARPGRAYAIEQFVDFAKSFGREVWICTREQIANHWYENHLPRGVGSPIQPTTGRTSYGSGNAASRFSFLGNLTTPRDEQPTTAPTISTFSSEPEGDII